MGFFGKHDDPEDQIQTAPEPQPDIEKPVPAHEETSAAQPPVIPTAAVIDPELERRVVRKLDLRVPTLLGFFCKLSKYNCLFKKAHC